MPKGKPKLALGEVHARLFVEDLDEVKRRAAEKHIPWQIELRLLVHRAVGARDVKILGG
jgi:predicted DNA binding CopG/RHH family protein